MSKTRLKSKKINPNEEAPIKKRKFSPPFPEKRRDLKPDKQFIDPNWVGVEGIKYIRSLERHILILENSLKKDYDKYEVGMGELEEKKNKLNQRYQGKVAENKQLKTELTKDKNTVNFLSAKLKKQDKVKKNIIDENKKEISKLNENIASLIDNNMDLSNRLNEKEEKILDLEKNISQLKDEMKSKEEYIKTIDGMFDYRAAIINELINKNQEYKNTNEKLCNEKAEIMKDVDQLKLENQLLKNQNQSNTQCPAPSLVVKKPSNETGRTYQFINHFTFPNSSSNQKLVVEKNIPPTEKQNFSF